MRTFTPSRVSAFALLFTLALSPGLAPGQAPPAPDEYARTYEIRVQKLADEIVTPQLLRALSSEERQKLGSFSIDIIHSRDVLRIELEPKRGDATRLVISVGHMIIQNILVDASVVGILAGNTEDLITYSVNTTRFALQAGDSEPDTKAPKPFWRELGWGQLRRWDNS